MSPRKDSEKGSSINGNGGELLEDGVISCHQNEKDCGNLKVRGHFAYEAGSDLWMIIGEEQHEKAYQNDDIPSDDDDRQPAGKDFDNGKGDVCRGEEEFVSDGIEISTQFSSFVSNTRNHAVDSIRNPCHRKSDKGPFKKLVDNEDDKDWDQKDPYEGHNIRQIHSL